MPAVPPPGAALGRTDASLVPYLLLLGAIGLAGAGLGLGLLFGWADYGQVQALGRVVYHENQFVRLPLAATPARLAGLRWVLGLAGLVGILGMAALRRQVAAGPLGAEWRGLRRQLRRWQQQRPAVAQASALVLLALLAAVRGWYLLRYPLSTDEVGSYDFFVQHGLLAITSFYPIPNNHILYNLLAWPLAQAGLPPLLAMRLPGLLLGLAGTAAGYVLLTRLAGERLALAITGLTGMAPLWAYYAVAGRGYFVQIGLLQVGFFATIALLRAAPAYPRLAWLGFVASSILGLYLIPTYAYPLISLGLGLGSGLLWQRRWRALGNLAVAGVAIGLVVLLLYSPVAAISGWDRLVGNHYVTAKTPAQFWPTYRAFLYETAASLFGPHLRVSGPLWLGTALAGGGISWYLLRGTAAPRRTAALLSWLLLALPLVLMAAQRVYAPTRMLLYLTFFGYLLLALWLQRAVRWRSIPARGQLLLIMGGVTALGGYRLHENQGQLRALRLESQRLEAAYHWLRAQPAPRHQPPRVWLHAAFHELFFAHYELQTSAARRLLMVTQRVTTPAGGYDYLVIGKRAEDRALPRPGAGYEARYEDALVTIYQKRAPALPPAPAN
jgi:hypothetical protein